MMKKASVFLIYGIMTVILSSLLIASPSTNRSDTSEIEDPPEDRRGNNPNYSITRNALDKIDDSKVWSDATTIAKQSPFGHSVSAETNVESVISIYLRGRYTVSATLNHDWVHPARYLYKYAYRGDHDGENPHVPRDTIEYCLADGNASAKDVRTRSVRWSTSVYIPW